MKTAFLSFCLTLCHLAYAQNTPSPTVSEPSGYANYSIMLVNPVGGSVVLMHTPKNALELVDTTKIKSALSAGDVPVRAAELAELLTTLREENIRLSNENARLQNAVPKAADSSELNRTNCHTFHWLMAATVDQIKTCTELYPSTLEDMRSPTPQVQPSNPSPSESESHERAMIAAQQAEAARMEAERSNAELAARRQQLLQTWMTLQAMKPAFQPLPLPIPARTYQSNKIQADCATQKVGDVAYTHCN